VVGLIKKTDIAIFKTRYANSSYPYPHLVLFFFKESEGKEYAYGKKRVKAVLLMPGGFFTGSHDPLFEAAHENAHKDTDNFLVTVYERLNTQI
jgi:hypothetical protein